MSIPGIPQNVLAQTGNQQILISWDLSAGASTYKIQRSLDNVTYTDLATISGSPLAVNYTDSSISLGVMYYYQVSSSSDGVSFSPYSSVVSAIPTPQGEVSLKWIRDRAKERADKVNSNFVSLEEWNQYINQAQYELYDLLITTFEDYNVATPIQFVSDGVTFLYDLPTGSNPFINALTMSTFTPPAIYKLLGVDLAVQNANQAYVTVNKFNFIDRNRFVYPNTASTIYGVFNLQYRWMGTKLMFIPTPSAGQALRVWYIPRLTNLLLDTDTTNTSISGWVEYVIVRAAKYAVNKEEGDTTPLDQELLFLKQRIEESAANRDAGQPDKISDTRSRSSDGNGGGFDGRQGGF